MKIEGDGALVKVAAQAIDRGEQVFLVRKGDGQRYPARSVFLTAEGLVRVEIDREEVVIYFAPGELSMVIESSGG